jgi:LPXTG-motif cell wall-anchored protein
MLRRGLLAGTALGLVLFGATSVASAALNSGNIQTILGTGVVGSGGDNGIGTSAQLNFPGMTAIVGDTAYITDCNNNSVRALNLTNDQVTTVAGTTGTSTSGYTGDGGPATAAAASCPFAIAAAPTQGVLYFGDYYNNVIRAVDMKTGIITTFAGTGSAGNPSSAADVTGSAKSIDVGYVYAVATDAAGNLYVGQYNRDKGWITKITPSGQESLYAGLGSNTDVNFSGAATDASLGQLESLGIDPNGNLYVYDNQSVVRQITTDGQISTVFGNGTSGNSGDGGPALSAEINYIAGYAFSPTGDVYFSDFGNNNIRELAKNGTVSTIAGGGNTSAVGYTGSATDVKFKGLWGLGFYNNTLLAIDYDGQAVYQIGVTPTPAPTTTTAVTTTTTAVTLAHTGSNSESHLVIGFGAIAVGGALLVAARRRRA